MESDGDLSGPVFVDEEEATKQDPLRIECRIDDLDVEVTGVKFWRPDEFTRLRLFCSL